MSRQDKVIAWILILEGAMALATLAYAWYVSPSIGTLLLLGPLSLMSIGAGIGILRRRRWAYILGMIVLLVQVPAVQTPWFYYFLWLGLQFKIYVGTIGAWQVGINLLALAILVWLGYRYNIVGSPSNPVLDSKGA